MFDTAPPITGEFYTEPQYAEEMEVLLSSWYHAGFEGLEVGGI